MAKGGLNGFVSTEVQNSTSVLRLKFSSKNPAHRQYAGDATKSLRAFVASPAGLKRTIVFNETKLENIGQLESLVEIDLNEHRLKEITFFFVNAMNDWDTYNQKNISEFIKEFEDYFGRPITIEKLKNNPIELSENDVWKHESKSSIIEMIELSKLHYQQSNFEKIINEIVNYYQKQLEKVDFLADLKYRTTEEGGRKTPAFSKYRPQIKFDFDEMQTSGEQTFLNKEIVNPGDEVKVAIRILGVDYFSNRLEEDMDFEFREGSRIIGTGKITQILNEKLRKPAGNKRLETQGGVNVFD